MKINCGISQSCSRHYLTTQNREEAIISAALWENSGTLFDIKSEEMIEPNVSVWLFISTVYMPKIRFDLKEHLNMLEYDLFGLIYFHCTEVKI